MLRFEIMRLAFAFFLLSSTLAYAASGQFEGVYVREGSYGALTQQSKDELQLKCVLAPAVIAADGFGTGYFLDTERFRSSGEVSYIKGQEFDCRYNSATKLETCQSREFSDGKSLRYYRSNVYQVFTPTLQQGHSLMTPDDVANWNIKGVLNPANRFAYHRCTCIDHAKVESHASPVANELSGIETGDRLYWGDTNPSLEDLNTARDVLDQLGACNTGNTS